MRHLRRIDIFPKFDATFERDAREKTVLGATLSLAALVVIVALLIGEFRYFFTKSVRHEMYVDRDIDGDISISVNISFPRVPCDLITIDAVDMFGEFQQDLDTRAKKTRIRDELHLDEAPPIVNHKRVETTPVNEAGEAKENCPSCYGAESHPGECCVTCKDVERAYNSRGWHFDINDISVKQCAAERLDRAKALLHHEGCNIAAKLSVPRVQGNLHFIPGRAFNILGQHVHDIGGEELKQLNLSHTFHHLTFGEPFPGQANPLDGFSNEAVGLAKFSYFVKIIPTLYEQQELSVSPFSANTKRESNQYSVTHHFTPNELNAKILPGVFVSYDLSPIRVRVFESYAYSSWTHFSLQLCAITGGVFTVIGLVDSALHHGVAQVRRKIALGKQS